MCFHGVNSLPDKSSSCSLSMSAPPVPSGPLLRSATMGVIEARRASASGDGVPSAGDVEASAEHLFMQAMAGSMSLDHLGDVFFLFCEHGRGRKIKAGLTDTVVSVRATSKKQRRSLSTKGWLAMLSRVPRSCPIVPDRVPVRQARSIFARNVAFSASADQMGELRFPHFLEALVDVAQSAFPSADDFASVRVLVQEALVQLYEMEMGTAPAMLDLDEGGTAARPDITAGASAQRGGRVPSPPRGSGASVASSSAYVAARTSDLVLTSQGTMSLHRARQLGLAAMPTRTKSVVHPGGASSQAGSSVRGDSVSSGLLASEAPSVAGARVGLAGRSATLGRRTFSMRGSALRQDQQEADLPSDHRPSPAPAAAAGPTPTGAGPDGGAERGTAERGADAVAAADANAGESPDATPVRGGRKRIAIKSLDLAVEGGSARLQSTASPGVALSPAGQRASVSLRGGALSAPPSPSGAKKGDAVSGPAGDEDASARGAHSQTSNPPGSKFFASAMGKRGRSPFQRQQTPAPDTFRQDLADAEDGAEPAPTDGTPEARSPPPPPPPPHTHTDEGAASGNGSPASASSSQGRPGGLAGVAGSSGSASPDSSRGAVRPFAHGHASPPAPPPRASHDGEPRHGDHEAPRQAGGGEPGRDPLAPAGERADGAGPLDSPAIRRARRGSVHSPQAVAASSIHTAVIAALEGGALDTAKPGGRELLGAIKQMLGAMSQAAQANRELRARVEELVMRVTQLRHATMEAAADS
ncbi:hypothetical protein FNF31_06927 [Cafeteria roenbergensis]|uniref:Uncharacterized protein n=1 Tax=Cafeteria roenbergensis TaxID=33653 RepID=A0A5A8CD07_CAFRO|nr:hypothetical protein FNF31_06927 [Cafeteria roenbergensis]